MMDPSKVFDKSFIFAVAGASNNPQKYGSRVYQMLKSEGVEVYPINPNRKTVHGDVTFPSIDKAPKKIDVLSIVTPPHVSFEIVTKAIEMGVPNIWLQPGAQDNEVVKLLESHPEINGIYNHCILTENEFDG